MKINPLDTNPDIAIGMKLPVASTGTSLFSLNYTTIEQANTDIRNLILTNKGERVMLPDYGCNIRKLIFEQNSIVVDQAEELIRSAVSKWIPFITVYQIDIQVDERNENAVRIKIVYYLNSNPTELNSLSINIVTG